MKKLLGLLLCLFSGIQAAAPETSYSEPVCLQMSLEGTDVFMLNDDQIKGISDLIDGGCNPNIKLADGTMLADALIRHSCWDHLIPLAKKLINTGAALCYPLHTVFNVELAKAIINKGYSVYQFDDNGRTPIQAQKSTEVIHWLFRQGISSRDLKPCSKAVYTDETLIQIAVFNTVDINMQDKKGRTGLMKLCLLGEARTVLPTMLRLGAKVNARDNAGNTALHYLLYGVFVDDSRACSLFGQLRSYGACFIKNHAGISPLQLACIRLSRGLISGDKNSDRYKENVRQALCLYSQEEAHDLAPNDQERYVNDLFYFYEKSLSENRELRKLSGQELCKF